MPRDVFISYRSEDKPSADRICAALERENIRCWIAPRDIPIGQEWASSIVSALGECSRFILVLSSHSTTAKQISREAELADQRGLPILTVRIEDVQPPPELMYFLGNLQWLDAFGDNYDSAMARLAQVIRGDGKPAETMPVAAAPPKLAAAMPPVVERIAANHGGILSAGRNGLPSYVWAVAAVLAIAIGLGIWLVTRGGPSQGKEASEFGLTYLKTRDSGDVDKAYAMLGPQMQSNWSRERFGSAVAALKAHGQPDRYSGTVPCTVRERGAYSCDYQLSYKEGRAVDERLTIAKRDGAWAIASDRMASAAE